MTNKSQNRNSLYSLYSLSSEKCEVDEILNLYNDTTEHFYINDNIESLKSISVSFISESMPIPISDENMKKLKSQWNKNSDFTIKEKNIWKKLSCSIKSKVNISPKRSFYDVLTK